VHWSGSDSLSGFDRFDVQVRRDGGAWEDWLLAQGATSTIAWFYGEPGHSYAFRVRGRVARGSYCFFLVGSRYRREDTAPEFHRFAN